MNDPAHHWGTPYSTDGAFAAGFGMWILHHLGLLVVSLLALPFPGWLYSAVWLAAAPVPAIALTTVLYYRLPDRARVASFLLGVGALPMAISVLLLGLAQSNVEVWLLLWLPVGAAAAAWFGCRCFRGRLYVWDPRRCYFCGYSEIGNVTGRCTECGSWFADDPRREQASSPATDNDA